jgi:hypothetical protein
MLSGFTRQQYPGELPSGVTVVSNDTGITGGIKLWERI